MHKMAQVLKANKVMMKSSISIFNHSSSNLITIYPNINVIYRFANSSRSTRAISTTEKLVRDCSEDFDSSTHKVQ